MLQKFVTAPVAHWVKGRPTDLAVSGSIPARGEILSILNGAQLPTAFQNRPPIAHSADITKILLKRA